MYKFHVDILIFFAFLPPKPLSLSLSFLLPTKTPPTHTLFTLSLCSVPLSLLSQARPLPLWMRKGTAFAVLFDRMPSLACHCFISSPPFDAFLQIFRWFFELGLLFYLQFSNKFQYSPNFSVQIFCLISSVCQFLSNPVIFSHLCYDYLAHCCVILYFYVEFMIFRLWSPSD